MDQRLFNEQKATSYIKWEVFQMVFSDLGRAIRVCLRLCAIYIINSDLAQKVKSHCVLFADDAKLFKELKQLKDFEEIQDDLYELCVWASKW